MLKGAIIGLGKIAQTAHIPAYLSADLKNKIAIVAGVDTAEQNSLKFIELVPSAKRYKTIEDTYSNEKIDFIDICVPPNLHGKFIKFAIKKKINILCEKPFTTKLPEAEKLKERLFNSGVIYYPFHQYKYSPIWKTFKDTSQKPGALNKVFLQFNVFRLSADSGFDYKHPKWRTDRSMSGGGILADTGSHYFYLVNYILGKPLEISSHHFKLRKSFYSVEDTTITVIKTSKGIAQINLTWAADKRMNTAYMTDGSKSLYYDGLKLELSENGTTKQFNVPDASDKRTYITLYKNLIQDFISDVESQNRNGELIDESINVAKMLYYSYKSDRLKTSIRL